MILYRSYIECDNKDKFTETTDYTEQGTETSTKQVERRTDKTQLF